MKDIKNVLDLMKRHKKKVVAAIVIVICLPLPYFGFPCKWAEFASFSTYIYTCVTVLTLLVIIGAAYLAMEQLPILQQQLEENTRIRKLAFLPQWVEEQRKADDARGRIADAYCDNPGMFKSPVVLGDQLRKDCRTVMLIISNIGAFIKQGLIEEGLEKDLFHIVPVRMYYILQDYIKEQHELRNYQYWGVELKFLAMLGIEHWFDLQENLDEEKRGDGIIIFHSYDRSKDRSISNENLKKMWRELYDELKAIKWLPKNFVISDRRKALLETTAARE